MSKTKKFEDLTIGDDFMFGAVMGNPNNNLCKEFLEALLGVEIDHIEYIDRQKDLSDDYNAHGIRLDVYIKDDVGTIYNMEMQAKSDAIEKRARFYQSGIDRHQLMTAESYHQLKDSFVIFVCKFDHFGLSEPVYERCCTIKGHPDTQYVDGSHVFILNSKFVEECATGVDERILDFLRLVENEHAKTTTKFAQNVKAEVNSVKSDARKEEAYMTYQMRMQEVAYESRCEGEHKEFLRILLAKLNKGITSPSALADAMETSVDKVEDGIRELRAQTNSTD